MKILFGYGKHPYTTATFIEKVLCIEHEVTTFGISKNAQPHDIEVKHATASMQDILWQYRQKMHTEPDIIFIAESGVPFYPMGLETIDIPKIYYSIDPHFNSNWHKNYIVLFDAAFISFRQFIKLINLYVDYEIIHLPHGYDHTLYYEESIPKRFDISFVGDLNPLRKKRVRVLQNLQDHLDCQIHTNVWGEDVRQIYSSSWIVFNENAFGVMNPRNFEASACGSLVLTNHAIDMEQFFNPGKDNVLYSNEHDALEQASYYLNHRKELIHIAKTGQKKTTECATWVHRLNLLQDGLNQACANDLHQDLLSQKYHMGETYRKRRFYEAAAFMFQQALSINSESPQIFYGIGSLLMDMGKMDQAMTCFERVLLIDPSYYDALFKLAMIRYDTGDQKALRILETLYDISPHYDNLLVLSSILIQSNPIRAQKLLLEAFQLDPYRWEARQYLEQCYGIDVEEND